MNLITQDEFYEKFDYEEGSGLFQNTHFKLIQDNDKCFWIPSNADYKSMTKLDVSWFLDNNITFDRCLDVGAGIGIDAAVLSSISNTIESWDISQYAYRCLVANLEIAAGTYAKGKTFNKHHCAITDSNEYSIEVAEYINYPSENLITHNNEYKLPNPDNFILLKQQTIDSYNFDNVDFIKFDVNGFELNALKGALETIQNNKPFIFINFDTNKMSKYEASSDEARNLLLNLNYHEVSKNIFSSK